MNQIRITRVLLALLVAFSFSCSPEKTEEPTLFEDSEVKFSDSPYYHKLISLGFNVDLSSEARITNEKV